MVLLDQVKVATTETMTRPMAVTPVFQPLVVMAWFKKARSATTAMMMTQTRALAPARRLAAATVLFGWIVNVAMTATPMNSMRVGTTARWLVAVMAYTDEILPLNKKASKNAMMATTN